MPCQYLSISTYCLCFTAFVSSSSSSSSALLAGVGDQASPHLPISNSIYHFVCWHHSMSWKMVSRNSLSFSSSISLSTNLASCHNRFQLLSSHNVTNKLCLFMMFVLNTFVSQPHSKHLDIFFFFLTVHELSVFFCKTRFLIPQAFVYY